MASIGRFSKSVNTGHAEGAATIDVRADGTDRKIRGSKPKFEPPPE